MIAERYLVSSCTVRAGKEGVSVASLHGVLPDSEAWPLPGFGQILGRGRTKAWALTPGQTLNINASVRLNELT